MFLNLWYIVLAALGLGFLVFIHEFGHYLMAKWMGMRIEAFAIGFGKPLISWKWREVEWRLCMLPFGGYVRIAGMEKQGDLEPYQIPNGFYSKPPWKRIAVASAGPLTNILFAFVAFSLIWMSGGLQKPFSELTRIVGWVEPQSSLYTQDKLRPGDSLTSFAGKPLEGFTDLWYAAIIDHKQGLLTGFHNDFLKQQHHSFSYPFDPSQKGLDGVENIAPASYLIYSKSIETSTIDQSGIQPQDRILWVNGELVFSSMQLKEVINRPQVLLTILREKESLLTSIPLFKSSDITMNTLEKEEIEDRRHEMHLSTKAADLLSIPYSFSFDGTVEYPLSYINERVEKTIFEPNPRASLAIPLLPGDKIVAVDGYPVRHAGEILAKLQEKHVRIIVQRHPSRSLTSWKIADQNFFSEISKNDLKELINLASNNIDMQSMGDLVLLKPILPQAYLASSALQQEQEAILQAIHRIEDLKQRDAAFGALEKEQRALKLGAMLQDQYVLYNPAPWYLVGSVFEQTWRTLSGLISGHLSPKAIQGPVGIVQVMQQQGWSKGVKEALFWMAFISLNLAILNLLPIPILDGGHICISIIESITKKHLKAKTMEWLIVPFIILFIAFFLFVTYQDILRLIKNWI